jgi:NAD(P)-dependent dehydrogenase (short-subunit alcohol dehydrogenase family)
MLQSLENSIKNDVAITDTPKRDQRGIFYPKVCDITNERAVQDVFVWVDDALGGVSVLVNNAGIIIRTSLLGKCLLLLLLLLFHKLHSVNIIQYLQHSIFGNV